MKTVQHYTYQESREPKGENFTNNYHPMTDIFRSTMAEERPKPYTFQNQREDLYLLAGVIYEAICCEISIHDYGHRYELVIECDETGNIYLIAVSMGDPLICRVKDQDQWRSWANLSSDGKTVNSFFKLICRTNHLR